MLVVVMALCGAGVNAQSFSWKDLRYEVLVGLNTATVTDPFSDGVVGFNIGAKATAPIKSWGKGDLYGAASLLYTKKGGKDASHMDALLDDGKRIKSGYLALPVHIGFEYNFTEKWGAFIDAGPYIAFGLNGNHFGDQEDFSLKRFDAGVGYGFGVRFKKRFAFSMNMNLGCVNMKKGDVDYERYGDNGDSWRNTNVELTFQWVIGKKNK